MVNFSIFNELSLPLQDLSEFEEFFKVLESLKSNGLTKIRMDRPFTHYSEILPSRTFQEVIGQVRDRDKKRRLLSFINSTILTIESPLISDYEIEDNEEGIVSDYRYNGQLTFGGLACSDIWNSIAVSFNSSGEWNKDIILIQKNGIDVNIKHASKVNHLDSFKDFFEGLDVEPLEYCLRKFKDSNLNFSLLEQGYGFDTLNSLQQKEFLSTFHKFSKMSWYDIIKSSANIKGLNYKSYDGDWFKNTGYSKLNIFKFRASQKYRCFGYREQDEFFVLRFEIDHKMSDNG